MTVSELDFPAEVSNYIGSVFQLNLLGFFSPASQKWKLKLQVYLKHLIKLKKENELQKSTSCK